MHRWLQFWVAQITTWKHQKFQPEKWLIAWYTLQLQFTQDEQGNPTWSKAPSEHGLNIKTVWPGLILPDSKMEQSARILLCLLFTPNVFTLNFSPNRRLVSGRQAAYPLEACSSGGATSSTVTLAAGEGRKFQSPGFPASYGSKISCKYNFEPACGARLVFECASVDLAATSGVGDLCTGDYLRFYDETGDLGESGVRYCFNNKPSFTYSTNIIVLFKTNNDGKSGGGKSIFHFVKGKPSSSNFFETWNLP